MKVSISILKRYWLEKCRESTLHWLCMRFHHGRRPKSAQQVMSFRCSDCSAVLFVNTSPAWVNAACKCFSFDHLSGCIEEIRCWLSKLFQDEYLVLELCTLYVSSGFIHDVANTSTCESHHSRTIILLSPSFYVMSNEMSLCWTVTLRTSRQMSVTVDSTDWCPSWCEPSAVADDGPCSAYDCSGRPRIIRFSAFE